MRGINDDEIIDFGRLSLDHPFHIRFIEYMPIGNSRTSSRDQILTPEIKEKIATIGELVPVDSGYMTVRPGATASQAPWEKSDSSVP
jgi:cyclic pyranopterin phosphate synthase